MIRRSALQDAISDLQGNPANHSTAASQVCCTKRDKGLNLVQLVLAFIPRFQPEYAEPPDTNLQGTLDSAKPARKNPHNSLSIQSKTSAGQEATA